jgi:hypothetical protein
MRVASRAWVRARFRKSPEHDSNHQTTPPRHHTHNAAHSTPQLGPAPPSIPPPIIHALNPPPHPAKCHAIITTRGRIHMHPRHQINQQTAPRPLRTHTGHTGTKQHAERCSRPQSTQHAPPHRRPRPQARHDRHLRPRHRQTYRMHRPPTRSQRSHLTQNATEARVLGRSNRRWPT